MSFRAPSLAPAGSLPKSAGSIRSQISLPVLLHRECLGAGEAPHSTPAVQDSEKEAVAKITCLVFPTGLFWGDILFSLVPEESTDTVLEI